MKLKLYINVMKTIISLVVFLLYSTTSYGKSNINRPTAYVITTLQPPTTGVLRLHFCVKFADTTELFDTLRLYQLGGDFWELDSNATLSGSYYPGDSAVFCVKISFDSSNLPYYPRVITFLQPGLSRFDDTFDLRIQGRVYFTPWGQAEIWSNRDFFGSIDRVWSNPNYDPTATRIYVNPSTIPASDINAVDSVAEDWQDNYETIRVPGLAYMVKMKAKHPDSISFYSTFYGDYSTYHDTTDYFENSAITIIPRYIGRIRGRLVSTKLSDIPTAIGQIDTIGLAGVNVYLDEQDFYGIETFDEGHTNLNGEFDLSFDERQTWEGGDLELILRLKSKNKILNIKVTEEKFRKGTFQDEFFVGHRGNDFDVDLGLIMVDDDMEDGNNTNDAFKALSWGVRAETFMINNTNTGGNFTGFNMELNRDVSHAIPYNPLVGVHGPLAQRGATNQILN
jgi:hypothetical protein